MNKHEGNPRFQEKPRIKHPESDFRHTTQPLRNFEQGSKVEIFPCQGSLRVQGFRYAWSIEGEILEVKPSPKQPNNPSVVVEAKRMHPDTHQILVEKLHLGGGTAAAAKKPLI